MKVSALGAAAALAVVVPLLALPTAWAGPGAELCTADPARGSVPVDFVLDACIDAAGVVVRNALDIPVVVTARGDLGMAQRVNPSDEPQDVLVRLSGGHELVLVPGDVVRWPLGASGGEIVVSGLSEPAEVAVSDALRDLLPRPGEPDVLPDAPQSLAALVRVTAAAVADRAACVEGKNFLGRAACDVDATTAIGEAAAVRLSRAEATWAMPVILDPENWAEWGAHRPAPVGSPAERTLRLAATGQTASAPDPDVVPPSPVLPAPAPAVSVPVPVPVPVPAPAPVPPQGMPTLPAAPTWGSLTVPPDVAATDSGNGNGKHKGKWKGKGKGRGKK